MKVGDWVEGNNGYGLIVKIYSDYYQYWDDDIPAQKKPGDKKQDDVVIKRFCSFDFKVYPQTQLNSIKFVSKVTKKNMHKINRLLEDEKTLKRFNNYKVDDDICEVANFDQNLTTQIVCNIDKGLKKIPDNGNLSMTAREIEDYLKKKYKIDLIDNEKFIPNSYIQLTSVGLGIYRDNELLFKKIAINDKT